MLCTRVIINGTARFEGGTSREFPSHLSIKRSLNSTKKFMKNFYHML